MLNFFFLDSQAPTPGRGRGGVGESCDCSWGRRLLTRAQHLDEVTWTTKNWLGLQKQRISVVLHSLVIEKKIPPMALCLHTAIAEQVVNELACGGGGRVHGAKCLAALAGVA